MTKKLFLLIVSGLFFGVFAPILHAQTVSSNTFCTNVGNADPNQNPCAQRASNLTFYCQHDPRWRAHPFACENMSRAGCGPTSMAMVLSAFGSTMTPNQVADIFTTHNQYACGENGGTTMPAILTSPAANSAAVRTQLGLQVATTNLVSGGVFDVAQAEQFLNPTSGYIIIGSSNNFPSCRCGHIFVIDGANAANGTIRVRDPNNCSSGAPQEKPTGVEYRATDIPGWFYAYAVKVTR